MKGISNLHNKNSINTWIAILKMWEAFVLKSDSISPIFTKQISKLNDLGFIYPTLFFEAITQRQQRNKKGKLIEIFLSILNTLPGTIFLAFFLKLSKKFLPYFITTGEKKDERLDIKYAIKNFKNKLNDFTETKLSYL